ncbi:MAG: acetylglutamate kinase [Gemmatimonadaceae bacterium]
MSATQRTRGAADVCVIKLGGRTQRDPRLAQVLADLAGAGTRLVLVHGGGDQISELQRQMGREPQFVDGRRVTTREDLELIRMVLSGSTNKELVATLVSAGVRAVGLSGEDAGVLIGAHAYGGALGEVGSPDHVDATLIRLLLEHGYTPVISPVARHAESGNALNVNGDDAAAAIAVALGATELTFVVDMPGVMDQSDGVIPQLSQAQAELLIEGGAATGGMIAKLQAAQPALHGGVQRVRIAGIDSLAQPNGGTTLLPAGLAHVE